MLQVESGTKLREIAGTLRYGVDVLLSHRY